VTTRRKAPRIDTLRNQAAATVELLGTAGKVLETLHELAYDRQHATGELKVKGGQRDYALDRHGDPKARAAYRELGHAMDHACTRLTIAAHDVVRVVNDADTDATPARRHPITVSLVEMVELIDAQHRRFQRGEFNPGRTLPQPLGHRRPEAQLTKRIRELEAQLADRDRRIRDLEDEVRERAT
jgi:hypothetical protein